MIVLLSLLPSIGSSVIVDTNPDTVIHETIVIPVYADDENPETPIGIIAERMEDVRDFYLENSYNSVTFHSQIVGWVKLPRNLSSYLIETDEEGKLELDRAIFRDAISLVDNEVDFRKYDTLVIIHAGPSNQLSQTDGVYINTSFIPQSFSADGNTIVGASIVSEQYSAPTICHELGHRLGADDLYDYNYKNSSIGPWCLMSSGSSGFCGYTKQDLGFIQEDEIFDFENGTYRITLSPLSSDFFGYRLVKHQLPDGRVMYIEGRDDSLGSDIRLPSGGILIYIINETSINQRRGENEVIWYQESNWWREAPLRVGESIGISEHSISVEFIEINSEGYVLDVSTVIEEDWMLCERITLDEESEFRDVDIIWETEFDDSTTYYASAVVNRNSWNILQFYKSVNHGRNWELFFDSGRSFNVSSSQNDFVMYDFNLWVIGRFQLNGEWTDSAGVYLNEQLHFHNLTNFINDTRTHGISASCSQDTMYISLSVGSSSNRSICCITRFNGTWSSEFVVTNGEVTWPDMSTPSPTGGVPWISFYNSSGQFMIEFGSKIAIQIDEVYCWEHKIIQDSDSVLIVSHIVENGSQYLRVKEWTNDTGVSTVFNRGVYNPSLFSVFIGPQNQTWIIARDNGSIYSHILTMSGNTTEELPRYGWGTEYSASDNYVYDIEGPMVLAVDDLLISTLEYRGHPPEDAILEIWFFRETTSMGEDIGSVLIVIGGVSLAVIAIILVYFIKKK